MKISFSDDPCEVWLSPERVKAARGLLNWSQCDLARAAKVLVGHLNQFETYGVPLGAIDSAAIKAVLLTKVMFTTSEGRPGVVLKEKATAKLGQGYLEFGARLRRRPKL